eukprot:gene2321-2629_t
MSAYEAEQLVEQLHVTSIQQVGSLKFLKQHDAIQKLNLQAHHNAQTHSDEFVLQLLVSCDKMSVLVQELLVIEAWKERLYPLLSQHLADVVDSATSYLVLYHEAAVANLLETALEELQGKKAETDFSTALCGLTILRYLTDHITTLPLGLMGRLLSANDAIMTLLPLVDSPPWVRSGKGSAKLEKFIDGRWQLVAPGDRLKISQLDGQVWLSLVNLLVEPSCRAKYDPDEYRSARA